MNYSRFDRIIIGSSPIAVMHAIQSSRKGFKTALVEKDKRLGGAWKNQSLDMLGTVECACHLIEYYAGAYEKLSELLGINFVYLEPQPIKVFNDGKRTLYATKCSMLLDLLRLLYFLLGVTIIRCVNYVLPKNVKIKKGSHRSIPDLLERIRLVIRYRLLHLLEFEGLKGPEGGYVAFSKKLEESLEIHQVIIFKEQVLLLEKNKNQGIKVVFDSNSFILAKKITITESIYLTITDNTSSEICEIKGIMKQFWHLLIGIDYIFINTVNPYIHLPENESFHRITAPCSHQFPLISSQQNQLFLVQTRKDPKMINDLQSNLSKVLFICGITTYEHCPMKIHYSFMESFPIHPNRHLISKEILDPSVNIIRTFGDLGKSVIQNSEIAEV